MRYKEVENYNGLSLKLIYEVLKMKIAMLGHKRIPSREGGVEIVVEELATKMVERGHQVTVYNRKGAHVANGVQVDEIKKYRGIDMRWVPTINKKGLDALLYSFNASVQVSFSDSEVIHYHAEGSCGMMWIPKLFGKKLVVTIHGLDWQRAKWGGFASKYILFGEKMAVKYADEIIVLSKGVQNYFMETYGRGTTFIPNGVIEPEYKACNIIRKKYGLKECQYILFLARIVPEKGVHYLIEAYKKIKTDKKLVIAGGSSHTNEYFAEIKNMTEGIQNIVMTGFVEGDELKELYSNAYTYILPSDVEGMPLSLLEAMSYGNCCIVSDIAENVDVLNKNGYIFRKSDVASLKNVLEDILNNELETAVGEKAKDDILTKYNWSDIVEKTLDKYQQ